MSSFTDYLENAVLGHVLGGTSYTPPTLYLALFTTLPDDTGAGTEVSGGSYARQTFSMSVTGNSATNSAEVSFPAATASWGTVVGGAIYDAATGGNMLVHFSLDVSKAVASGDIVRAGIGNVSVSLS